MGRAVVAERSRALYLIDVLGMLKVEGSNPGVIIYFREKIINAFGRELAHVQ